MANSIDLRTNELADVIDMNYAAGSKTTILNKPSIIVREGALANEVKVAKRALTGYGDYNASANPHSKFPAGSVTQTWGTYTVENDRAVEFTVDRITNDDSGNIAFQDAISITGQFQREQANPEVDAIRFAKMAGTSGILTTTAAVLSASTVKTAIDTAITAMDEAEVPEENRVLFLSTTVYNYMKNSNFFTYNLKSDPTNGMIDTRFAEYDGMPVVKVQQSRFYTAIDLYDGVTTGETDGGYDKASGGLDINFMIVHQEAAIPWMKLEKFKYFNPDVNQGGDDHLWQSRLHHDLIVLDNKVEGIYLHKSTS